MPNPELTHRQIRRRIEIRARKAAQQGNRCWWCDKDFDPPKNAATIEHLVPLARGGAYWDEANIVAACRKCNSRRGSTGFLDTTKYGYSRPKWLIEALAPPIVGTKITV